MKSSLTLVLLSLLAVAAFATPAWAVSYYWIVDPLETGNFWTEANWNPEGVPGIDDYAYVNNGGTAEIDGDGSLSRLYVGIGDNGGTVVMESGTLTTNQLNVGRASGTNLGTLTVESGAQIDSQYLQIGYGDGSTPGLGTATVEGVVTFSAAARIGHAASNETGVGTGTLNVQNGGRVTGTASVSLGYRSGSVGMLNVTGAGSLFSTTEQLRVGLRGTGTVNVGSGGEVACGTLQIGPEHATAVGTVNLNSGGLISTGSVAMGNTANPAAILLNFDGGVLRATGDNVNFIADNNSDLLPSHVYVKSGGATIDTNGFDVVVHAALEQASGSTGGLTKNGEGRLVLASGANTYTGATTVNAGTLVAHGAMSPITVAAGATIMPGAWDAANAKLVDASLENVTLTTSSLTLADGTRIGTVLCGDEFGVDGVNRIATGALAVAGGGNATIGVELAGVTPTAAGVFDVITYVTKTGTFSFLTEYDSEGTLATNIVDTGSAVRVEFAGISDYWTGGGLERNYNDVDSWSNLVAPNGANRRAWFTGIGQTVDLDVNVTLSSLVFDAGDFDLSPVGGTSLTLDSSIAQKTQISNVAGSNTVSAPILLNKDTRITVAQVDDTLTLNGAVTGLGRIEKVGDGTLAMANLGGGPVGDLVLGGGTFRYTGATATTSRGLATAGEVTFDVSAADTVLTMTGNVASTGAVLTKKGAGTLELAVPEASANSLARELRIDEGTVRLAGGASHDVAYRVYVSAGQDNTGILDLDGASVNVADALVISDGAASTGTLTMSNGSALNVGGFVRIGRSSAIGTVTATDSTLVFAGNGTANVHIGYEAGGSGKVTLNNSNLRVGPVGGTTVDNEGTLYVGRRCEGELLVQGGSQVSLGNDLDIGLSNETADSGNGTVTVTGAGSSISVRDRARIASSNSNDGLTSKGTLNVEAGGQFSSASLYVGYYKQAVGTLNVTGEGSLVTASTLLRVGHSGTGTVNVGTGAEIACGTLEIGKGFDTAVGTVNLDGGALSATQVLMGSEDSIATLNFDGGTLRAAADNADFVVDNGTLGQSSVVVKSGGAKIDTAGYDVAINVDLVEDAVSTGGGLTKLGVGTLELGGANTYTGDTRVEGGTLTTLAALLDDDADVWISTGALFDLAFVGTDTIGGLFLGGVTKAIGTYGSSASGATYKLDTFFSGTGVLEVTSYVPNIQIPGDTNGDLKVDDTDAKRLAQYWGATGPMDGLTMLQMGDFNGDGKIDARDAAILSAQWGDYTTPQLSESQGTAVPEPGAAALLLTLLAGAAIGLGRRRHVA